MEVSSVKCCLNNLNYRKQSGLTLIEVLIALAIIGIAMTAIIKAATHNIKSTGYLQTKTIAMLVGQQVINEVRADLIRLDKSSQNQKLTTEMFEHDWYWQMNEEETPNNRIKKIIVKVFENENANENVESIITLESYRYHEKK